MPPRSNMFQDVVAIVESAMAGDATVEESVMLPSRSTGDLREVDIVVTSRVGAHEVRVGIEASRTNRRRSVEWVEQLASKHSDLPTDKLILVSRAGVSPAAQRLADARGIVVINVSDVSEDRENGNVIEKLRSIWPRTISIRFESCNVEAQAPDSLAIINEAPDCLDVVSSDGRLMGPLEFTLRGIVEDNWNTLIAQIGGYKTSESAVRDLNLNVQRPLVALNGVPGPACLRFTAADGTTQYHPILSLTAKAKCSIVVEELLDLESIRLGEISVAYAETVSAGARTIYVAAGSTDSESLFVRTREPGKPPRTIRLEPTQISDGTQDT